MEELTKIQSELKAPKNQYNSFGKYKYRSCEDILEALKPLLLKHKCTLTIADEIKECGGLVYVEARAEISAGDKHLIVTAQAGINPDRKGMDISQSFGSSSSYARKYALNGLFLIDDTKDADTKDNSAEPSKKPQAATKPKPDIVELRIGTMNFDRVKKFLIADGDYSELSKKYTISEEVKTALYEY